MSDQPTPPEGWAIIPNSNGLPLEEQSRDLAIFSSYTERFCTYVKGTELPVLYAVRLGSDLQKRLWPELTEAAPSWSADLYIDSLEQAVKSLRKLQQDKESWQQESLRLANQVQQLQEVFDTFSTQMKEILES